MFNNYLLRHYSNLSVLIKLSAKWRPSRQPKDFFSPLLLALVGLTPNLVKINS